MSKEAWGEEGNIPDNQKDTVMWQELHQISTNFLKWKREHKDHIKNSTEQVLADIAETSLEHLLEIVGEG